MTQKLHPVVNFSLRKEVFFVTLGSIIGAFTMHLPRIFIDFAGDSSYYLTLLVLASVINSTDPVVGFFLHFLVATIIGIVTGILLHKVIKFKISKILHGITYGIIAGIVVFVVFAIPVSQLILGPNTISLMSELNPKMPFVEITKQVEESFASQILSSLMMHIIWGISLGVVSSLFSRKMGANYCCHICDVEFSKLRTWENHNQRIHENPSPEIKKIVIIGGGYAGTGVLNRIQKSFQDSVNVNISLVSESNFFLHTPMLAEMVTGTIEPRHIATPIRKFCKRARFYQAKVKHIDINSKIISIQRITGRKEQTLLEYDFLVLATGSRTNFFGNQNIERHSLTIKSLDDAIKIRNHTISLLEDADQEQNPEKQNSLVTFVVVGGGFSGVETAGELNEFVRESVTKYYRNIPPESIKVILIASGEKILPEIGNLGQYAKDALSRAGVTIYPKTKLRDATDKKAILDDGQDIPYGMLIWAGGNRIDTVLSELRTEHHERSGRIVVNSNLQLENYSEIFALGDCAYIVNPKDNKPYPPTAQHAIKQAEIVASNLVTVVESSINKKINSKPKSEFLYNSKGSMAKIGKRDGVALLLGTEIHGFGAWFIWKQYYLSTLPSIEKKIRVGIDWFIDLFFPRDITRLSNVFDDVQK